MELPYQIPKTQYSVDLLPANRITEAMEIITKAWASEPLTFWSKISQQALYQIFLSLQDKALNNSPMHSIIITNLEGKIVGVSLNREFSLKYNFSYSSPLECLINSLENEYRKYYEEKRKHGEVFYIDSIGVLDEAKGRGLATHLILGSLIHAQKCGYDLCVIEATNSYTAHIAEKLGYKKITEINYDDFEYVDKAGNKSKVYKGIDKAFTDFLNKKRGSNKPVTHAANKCILYEGEIDKILVKTFPPMLLNGNSTKLNGSLNGPISKSLFSNSFNPLGYNNNVAQEIHK